MNKFNFSKIAKIGYKTVSYYSRAEEKKVKDFYKKTNTTVIYMILTVKFKKSHRTSVSI